MTSFIVNDRARKKTLWTKKRRPQHEAGAELSTFESPGKMKLIRRFLTQNHQRWVAWVCPSVCEASSLSAY